MSWPSNLFAEAIIERDRFEREIQTDTEESIRRVEASLRNPLWRAAFLLSPQIRRNCEESTTETVATMRKRLKDAAIIQAYKRSTMKSLSTEQMFEMGRYLIGTPDEGNVVTDLLEKEGKS
jgi:hypothetical protein